MQVPKEVRSCTNKALYRLSMGDLTCGEMMAYLTDPRRKNTAFPPETAQKCVQLLIDQGYLDDQRYLKILVSKMDASLYGPRKIKETLTRHLFPARFIEAALARRINYSRRAVKLLLTRKSALEEAKGDPGKKKLVDFLVRRGYDYATARSAVEQISKEDPFLE